jgi:hypothetical protein
MEYVQMFVDSDNTPDAGAFRQLVPSKLAEPPWNFSQSLKQNISVTNTTKTTIQ